MANRVTLKGTLVRKTVQETANRSEATICIATDGGSTRRRQRYVRTPENGRGRMMISVDEMTEYPTLRVRNTEGAAMINKVMNIPNRSHVTIKGHVSTSYDRDYGRMITYIDIDNIEVSGSMLTRWFSGLDEKRLKENGAAPDDQNLVLLSGKVQSVHIPSRNGVPRQGVTRVTLNVTDEKGNTASPTVTCFGPVSDQARKAVKGDTVLAAASLQTWRGDTPRERQAPWYEKQDLVCRAFGIYEMPAEKEHEEEAPEETGSMNNNE